MKYINYFLKGILIGISFLVPGMSGGTMMVLLGVFDEAIYSINSLINGKLHKFDFMVIMGIGTVISLVIFSPLILSLLNSTYELTISFFLGIIFSGFYLLFKEINIKSISFLDIVYITIGIIIVLVLDGQGTQLINLSAQSNIVRFITLLILGVPIAIALILPGISTSFMLLSFGAYEMVLDAIISVDLSIIIPLGIGTIIGTVLLTGFLERQLKSHKRRLYMIIIGFIFGSIIEMVEAMPIIEITKLPMMVILFIMGIAVMYIINRIKGLK